MVNIYLRTSGSNGVAEMEEEDDGLAAADLHPSNPSLLEALLDAWRWREEERRSQYGDSFSYRSNWSKIHLSGRAGSRNQGLCTHRKQ
jgi:hypothetical protein